MFNSDTAYITQLDTEYTKVCPKAGAGVTGRLSGVVAPRLRQRHL